jgi:hypothetical protein
MKPPWPTALVIQRLGFVNPRTTFDLARTLALVHDFRNTPPEPCPGKVHQFTCSITIVSIFDGPIIHVDLGWALAEVHSPLTLGP